MATLCYEQGSRGAQCSVGCEGGRLQETDLLQQQPMSSRSIFRTPPWVDVVNLGIFAEAS